MPGIDTLCMIYFPHNSHSLTVLVEGNCAPRTLPTPQRQCAPSTTQDYMETGCEFSPRESYRPFFAFSVLRAVNTGRIWWIFSPRNSRNAFRYFPVPTGDTATALAALSPACYSNLDITWVRVAKSPVGRGILFPVTQHLLGRTDQQSLAR